MAKPRKNILITGLPGVGKTTFIKRIADQLQMFSPVGFYTREIRQKSQRKGFELISFSGEKRLLAHTTIKSSHQVGKYRVDVEGFDDFLITLNPSASASDIVIIDEIGKMELFSHLFRRIITDLLHGDKKVIATIAKKGDGIIAKIKQRDDIALFELTRGNFKSLESQIMDYCKLT